MKILTLLLFILSFVQADYMCASAGADVEQYSQAYDNAIDDYESADTGEKADALEEVQVAKEQLLDAVDDVFNNCDNRQLRIMSDLLEENKILKKHIEKLENQIGNLMTEVAVLKIQKKYPRFDVDKIVSYLNQYQKKYGVEAADRLNSPEGWEKIWVENFDKKYSK